MLANVAAFSERICSRLKDADFSDRQAILQLIVERIIVHEDTLEIRHVIPLRDSDPADGPTRPAMPPNTGLRSDGRQTERKLALRLHQNCVRAEKGPTRLVVIQWVTAPIGTRGKSPGGGKLMGLRRTGMDPISARHVHFREDYPLKPVAWRALKLGLADREQVVDPHRRVCSCAP